jgi:hypothetical protein
MSAESSEQLEAEGTGDEVCAACGTAAVDDVKLKKCACNLVKYCSVDCQKSDRPKHKRACRKRLAEIHDNKLFTQPDSSHFGECPICCLPLSIDANKSTINSCCSQFICNGCCYANQKRETEGGLEQRCAFCREPAPYSDEEVDKRVMERIKKNDPVAMTEKGKQHENEGDFGKAFEYFTKSAELGDVAAHFCLGRLYHYGNSVEKDEKKAIHHLEQAAIGGHPQARGILATHKAKNGMPDIAAKHFIIAANLGCDVSLRGLKRLFVEGDVSKDEYAAALRGHQAAIDATKSAERDEAEEAIKNGSW